VEALEKALAPYQEILPKDTFKKLVASASVLMGIDALIVCKDICGLTNEEMDDTLQWALKIILRGILKDKADN
jgi:hypothetical protein